MKQILKITFLFFIILPLFIGCTGKAKTKGGRSFFYVWGNILKGEENREQRKKIGSFKRSKHIQQTLFDLGDNDYNIKILGTKNYPGGIMTFKDVGSQTGFAVASGDVNGDGIDDLIIGAPTAEGPLERPRRSGWVYIFFGRKSNSNFGLSAQNADVSLFGGKSNVGALLGSSLASADVNGDGVDDIIIGAPKANVPFKKKRSQAGIIFVLFGKKFLSGIKDLSKQADITIYGADERDLSGYALATGDINGDDIADMLIGAPAGDGYKNASESAGETYLIYGRKKFPKKIDLAKNYNSKIYGSMANAESRLFKNNLPGRSGFALSSADINGDGLDDIIIGSPFSDGLKNKRRDAGTVSVIFGKKVLPRQIRLPRDADVTISGAQREDYAGYSLAAGDINGDGKNDILINAPYGGSETTAEGNKIGRVYGVFGRSEFPKKIDLRRRGADLIIKGKYYTMGEMFGGSLFRQNLTGYEGHTLSSGDVNGDGIDDIIIGAPNAVGLSRYGRDVGETYIIYGDKSLKGLKNLQREANITIFGADRGDIAGHALSAGDINGDGIDDILIGAPGAVTKSSNRRRKTGKVYVVYGMKE